MPDFRPSLFFKTLLFLVIFSSPVWAQTDFESLREQVVQKAERLQVAKQDDLQVLPRLEKAEAEMRQGHETLALELLDSCLFDLNLLATQSEFNAAPQIWKQARLEMLFDLLRGYAVTAVLAFLWIKWPWLRRRKKEPSAELEQGGFRTVSFLTLAALIFGFTEIQKYGDAAASYFDLQVVLAACIGLIAGRGAAILSLLSLAGVRLGLASDANMAAVLLICGLAGNMWGWVASHYKQQGLCILGAAITAGMLHAVWIYGPLIGTLPPAYLAGAAVFIALTEAFGIFLFCAVARGLLREERQETTERELLRSQLMFLQAQIKPHFLFNALNTIAAVCSSEKALKSRQLITRLADFFRHALETEDPVLPLGKELEFVDAYLELESARFGEDLKIVRHLVLSEKALAAKVPILVIQPLVENAIRHGLRKRTGAGTLTLEAFEEKDMAVIRISDDGAGAAPDFFENYLRHGKGQAEGHGIGVRNIDERLRRFFGKGDWVQFKTVLGQGTCAEVRIPLKGDLKV